MFYRLQMLHLASRAGRRFIQGFIGAMLSLFPALSQFGVHDDHEDADGEDEADDNGEADEEEIRHAHQNERTGLVSQRADADAGASPQHDSMENRDAQPPIGSEGEDDEEQDIDEEDEEEDEEWEPAPTRSELLKDAVQYLRQASAEHDEQNAAAAAATQDEEPVQVQRHSLLLNSHVS